MNRSRLDWRGRSALVFVVVLLFGHVAALWGLAAGMPAAPYGDESRFHWLLATETLRLVWVPWAGLSPDAHAPAPWGRAVLPLTAAWIAGEALARLARNPLRLYGAMRRGGHCVVAGLSPFSVRLLAHWRREGRAVVVVCASGEETERAVQAGAAAVRAPWGAQAFGRCGLARAATVLIAAATDLENLDMAAAAADFASARRAPNAPPLNMLLNVDDPLLRAHIDERIDRFGRLDTVQVRVVSSAQIAARRLVRDHPFDRFQYSAPGTNVWIVGLGRVGEQIALAILRLARYRHGRKPVLTVIDREAERRRASLLARWPGAESVGDLRFLGAEADQGESLVTRVVQDLPGERARPTAVYLCLASEEKNTALAMSIATLFARAGWTVPPLYLRRAGARPRPAGFGLEACTWVTGFGDVDWIADGALSLQAELDAIARHIHERYLAEALARGEAIGARRAVRPWVLLPEDLKDDNRTVADHHLVKLRDSGCRLVPLAGSGAGFEFEADEIEPLAEVEHVRWLASRELAGWRYAARRDDAAKLHPDMVAFGDLDESRKELDCAVIRGLPAVLREAGLGVARDFPVAVTGPRTHWAFLPGFDNAVAEELAQLKREKPSRQIVLWTTLESALACRVAEIGLNQGMAKLALALSATPAAVLSRQQDETVRNRMRALLSSADRVIMVPDGAESAASIVQGKGAVVLVLAVDAADLPRGPDVLGIDAAGHVLCRPNTGALPN